MIGAEGADAPNGFELDKLAVERSEILSGGPPRDGVKSVDTPEFASPEEASRWVLPDNPVLGVAVGGVARAYPVHLIEFHQVVNDELGGAPVVVTYDPLAGTPRAFRATADGKRLHFGVSGLIYKSNFLLYDRETESLWSQFHGRAIAGPLAGRTLERIPVRQETLAAWHDRYSETAVLARPEPKRIDYRYSPYSAYWVEDKIPFPVDAKDERFHPKEVVLGVEVDGRSRAYLGSVMTAAGGRVVDELAGRKLRIAYDGESSTFIWDAPDDVAVSDAYWFAWKNFHPDTETWRASRATPSP